MKETTEYDFSKGQRGAVSPLGTGQIRVTLTLDEEILEWFRAKVNANGGGDYSALINAALREHIANEGEPLEQLLRRVLREELTPAA